MGMTAFHKTGHDCCSLGDMMRAQGGGGIAKALVLIGRVLPATPISSAS
jgi:hypothetical protein